MVAWDVVFGILCLVRAVHYLSMLRRSLFMPGIGICYQWQGLLTHVAKAPEKRLSESVVADEEPRSGDALDPDMNMPKLGKLHLLTVHRRSRW